MKTVLETVSGLQPEVKSRNARWSITSRLAWHYALATSAILILAAGFLYWGLVAVLEMEDEQFLGSRVHVLAHMLQNEDAGGLERELHQDTAAFARAPHHVHTRILDEAGRTLHAPAGMDREVAPGVFRIQASPRKNNQVAGEELLLGRYTRYLGGVLVAGILLSVGVGVFAAPQHAADGTDHVRRRTRDRQPVGRTARRGPMAAGTGSLAQAFNGMLDRLEESFVRLSQFSADLAHELHTPISNLRGETEVALSRPRTNDEYREILESGMEEYERLSRMTDSLIAGKRTGCWRLASSRFLSAGCRMTFQVVAAQMDDFPVASVQFLRPVIPLYTGELIHNRRALILISVSHT